MKYTIQKTFIHKKVVFFVWPSLIVAYEKISGIPHLKACTLFPGVIVLKDEQHKNDHLIHHEKIHFRQLIETAIIGYILIYFVLEPIYYRGICGYTAEQSYYLSCFEQECYRNQHHDDYLPRRVWFAWTKYIRKKHKKHIRHIDGVLHINEISSP